MVAASALHGFLVVDKPGGLTSHDVVARVRRAAGRRSRVGHAGTLDPMATGVLVLALGVATRLLEYATGQDKRYRAELTLGVETDTYDADGRVVAERTADVSAAELERALAPLRGQIEQRPPAFSAVQVGGRRLYDLARRGEAVEPPVRRVTIHELALLEWRPPRATIELLCSKGTYVRSLAHDLGRALGCGAHLSALRRLASGAFELADAVGLEAAVFEIAAGRGERLLRPLELAVAELPRLAPGAEGVAALRLGQPWAPPAEPIWPIMLGRAHDPGGELVAIVEWREGAWWPRKVLVR
jgi:tRNA pseudouridine55 synthase